MRNKVDKNVNTDEAYKNLAHAIVKKACDDYILARIRQEKHVKVYKTQDGREDANECMINDTLRFFYSDWYYEICDISPDVIVNMCEEIIKEKLEEERKPKRKKKNN